MIYTRCGAKCPTVHCIDTHMTKRAFHLFEQRCELPQFILWRKVTSCDIVDTQDET